MNAATTFGTWSATVGSGQEWLWKKYELIDRLEYGSNNIFAKTLRAMATFIICGNNGARVIRQLEPHFKPDSSLGKVAPTGPTVIGTLDGRLVIQDPFVSTNRIYLGFKGDSYLMAGFIYAPSNKNRRHYQVTDNENSVNCGNIRKISKYSLKEIWRDLESESGQSAAKSCVGSTPLCKCGCGKRVAFKNNLYVKGHSHSNKGQMVGDKNPAKRLEVRQKIKESLAKNKIRGALISKGRMGISVPSLCGNKNPAKRPEVRAKISKNNSMKRPDVVRKQILSASRRPNGAEIFLFKTLQKMLPQQYILNVVEKVVVIDNKTPDFANLKNKKLIELFGEKYHKLGSDISRIQMFQKFGWECLVVWSKELRAIGKLKEKLLKFHTQERFNDCNQNNSIELMGQSDPYGNIGSLAEMTKPLSLDKSNKGDIPLFATPTLITSDLHAQKGFLSASGFKVTNPGMFCYGDISGL